MDNSLFSCLFITFFLLDFNEIFIFLVKLNNKGIKYWNNDNVLIGFYIDGYSSPLMAPLLSAPVPLCLNSIAGGCRDNLVMKVFVAQV